MLELSYRVTLSDFREASYYGVFVRKRNMFRAAVAVLLFCFVYAVLWRNNIVQAEPIVPLFACAYLVWVLITLGGVEKQILKYARQPDTLIGVEYRACFEDGSFRFEIPERAFCVSGRISELSSAYELFHCFLIYVTGSDLFIVPISKLTKNETTALRQTLKSSLGDGFISMFDRDKSRK